MTDINISSSDLRNYVTDAINANQEIFKSLPITQICNAAITIGTTINAGKKVLVCGNGGSAADAQHFAAEFVGRMLKERRPLPCIALTTDTSAITAIANDYGYDQIFLRQVVALAAPGDVFIGISTSGKSPNICEAAKQANAQGSITVALTGDRPESPLVGLCDQSVMVPSTNTPRIQEAHIFILHCLIDIVDQYLLERG